MFQLDFENYTAQLKTDNKLIEPAWPMERSTNDEEHEEKALAMAQSLLKLGVLHWRRGNLDRSEQLLTKAKEVSGDTKDIRFLSQCYIGLALVKTRLEKTDEAIDAYQQAIELDPENLHLWNNLGSLYLQHNWPDKALSAFRKTISGNPNDASAWDGLANVHDQFGNVDEAICAYKRTIELMQGTKPEKFDGLTPELNKHFVYQWLRLGALYEKKCQYQKAIDAYQRVITYDAKNAEVWNELGALYKKMEAYEESKEALLKAIELYPEYGEAYLNLAYVHTKLGKHQDSIPFYMKSIELHPSQRARNLASKLMEEAMHIVKTKEAATTYKKVSEIRIGSSSQDKANWFYCRYNEEYTSVYLPYSIFDRKNTTKGKANRSGKNRYSRRFAYTNLRKNKNGRRKPGISSNLIKQLTVPLEDRGETMNNSEFNSTNPFVWNEKGNIHFKNQAYEDAIISYNKAIEIEPTFGQPYNNLALIHFIQGDYNEAILLYQKGIKLLTNDKEKAIAWNGLGNAYRCIKDYESARVAYQNASEFDKENGGVYESIANFEVSEKYKTADFWNDLGKLFFRSGAYERAASAFLESMRIEPSSGHAYGLLARALTAQGQYKEAISFYHKCIDLISDDKEKANAWNRLGDVYRKLNQYDNALKAYQNAMALLNDKSSLLSRTRLSLLSNCAAK